MRLASSKWHRLLVLGWKLEGKSLSVCPLCRHLSPADDSEAPPYCSEECQKKHCKKQPNRTTTKSEKQAKNERLIETIMLHSEEDILERKSGDAVSISSIASENFDAYGTGILVMELSTCKARDNMARSLPSGLEPIPNTSCRTPVPKLTYILWPPPDDRSIAIVRKLGKVDIDSFLLSEMQVEKEFLVSVIVEETDDVAFTTMNYVTRLGNAKNNREIAFPSRSGMSLCEMIAQEQSGAECRRLLAKLAVGPGVLWVYNLFHPDPAFTGDQVRLVTPELLNFAIQESMTKTKEASKGIRLFSPFDPACPLKENWDSILEADGCEIWSPHVVYVMFGVYPHKGRDEFSMMRATFYVEEPLWGENQPNQLNVLRGSPPLENSNRMM